MIFEEPKIELIPLEAGDIPLTTSGGAGIDVCAPGNVNDQSDFPCYGDD